MLIGYGGIALFLAFIVFVLERTRRKGGGFSDYATAGRSFGPFYSTMAFINTWLPGTIFISFAGYAAAAGVVGFYFVLYSLLAVVLMIFLAKPVHLWGKRFDLRTQADLLGLRYGSKTVRVVAALIGIVASFPWLVLGMQSLTFVFSYLSFGRVPASTAVYIGIAVIVVRQLWTIRMGARGIIISDMVQGIVAYGIGALLAAGLLTWLLTNGHGFDQVDPSFFTLPGPDSAVGGLYFFSIVITGALGGWSWPDIFVRLFTSNSAETIKKSAVQAAPIVFVFGSLVVLLAIAASTLPGVSEAPDAVWFIAADIGGPIVMTLAGLCVLAGTMGNVGANLQALGTQTANDIVAVVTDTRAESRRSGQIAVAVMAAAAAAFAAATANSSTHLVTLALISYQGIVQLAPTIFFGIFWRRGNASGAVAGMVTGFVTAAVLQWLYPTSIPELGGLTAGVAALVVNAGVYVACAYFIPSSVAERARVDDLFDSLSGPVAGAEPATTSESSLR